MTKRITLFAFMLMTFCFSYAQENVKYRITYDCEAEFVNGDREHYRWTLDVGESTAVFYNGNNRDYQKDLKAMLENRNFGGGIDLSSLGKKYPTRNELQILIGIPKMGMYTYTCNILSSHLKYEDVIPIIDWQLTDSIKTINGYYCQQAKGTLYGREWTAWYTSDVPLSYGPYILSGLPGLILAACDSEGIFNFMLAGLEEISDSSTVSFYIEEEPQKCSRKRFLEMRADNEGLTQQQMVDRILSQYSGEKSTKVVIKDENGKDVSNMKRATKNFLDKE